MLGGRTWVRCNFPIRRQMLYPPELRAHLIIRHLRRQFSDFGDCTPHRTKRTAFRFFEEAMRKNRQPKQRSAWESTRYQNLVRYVPSGTIFARIKIRGKQVRRSLKTSNLELAKNKLAELERNERSIAEDRRRGKMSFGEALDEYLQSLASVTQRSSRGPKPTTTSRS